MHGMVEWSNDIVDIVEAIDAPSSIAVSMLRKQWRLGTCAVTCQYVGSPLGETMLEFRWSVKPAVGAAECKDTLVLEAELVARESVHVPIGLHSFLEERDQPRRVAIDAALEARTSAKKMIGRGVDCKYLGQRLHYGGYGESPLDLQVPEYRGKRPIGRADLEIRWRVRVGHTLLNGVVFIKYDNMRKSGVTFFSRFQLANNASKGLPRCADSSIQRLRASLPRGASATCEVLGIQKSELNGTAQGSASVACSDNAIHHDMEAFEANPWQWPSDMQHSKVHVSVRWSVFGLGLPASFTSIIILNDALQRGYFPIPADALKALSQEFRHFRASAIHSRPTGDRAARCFESCSEDAPDDDSTPAAKVARVARLLKIRRASGDELRNHAGAPVAGGEITERLPASVKSEAGDSYEDFLALELEARGLNEEAIAEMNKSSSARALEDIEFKVAWGEPDKPPLCFYTSCRTKSKNNKPLNGTHLTRKTLERLRRTVRMAPKARTIVKLMIDRHRRRTWQTTPQHVIEVFGARPDGFARQAAIPMEEITELAQIQTCESIGDSVRHKLRDWQECANLCVCVCADDMTLHVQFVSGLAFRVGDHIRPDTCFVRSRQAAHTQSLP